MISKFIKTHKYKESDKTNISLASHIIFHLDLTIAQGTPTPAMDNHLGLDNIYSITQYFSKL